MVHGAPDYHKKVIMPPVDIEVQDLGIYPAWELNLNQEGNGGYPAGNTIYTVPAYKILYIFSAHITMDNRNNNRLAGYIRAEWIVQGGCGNLIRMYVPGFQMRYTCKYFSPPVKLLATEYVTVNTTGYSSDVRAGGFWGALRDA